MSKPRGEGPSPPFSIAPQVLPWGSLCDHACLRSSLPWGILPVIGLLVRLEAKQGKVGRGGTPAREISFVSLMAYGPKVCHSALAMGVTASETRQDSSQHKCTSLRILLLVFPWLIILEYTVRENEMTGKNVLRKKIHKNKINSLIQSIIVLDIAGNICVWRSWNQFLLVFKLI